MFYLSCVIYHAIDFTPTKPAPQCCSVVDLDINLDAGSISKKNDLAFRFGDGHGMNKHTKSGLASWQREKAKTFDS